MNSILMFYVLNTTRAHDQRGHGSPESQQGTTVGQSVEPSTVYYVAVVLAIKATANGFTDEFQVEF